MCTRAYSLSLTLFHFLTFSRSRSHIHTHTLVHSNTHTRSLTHTHAHTHICIHPSTHTHTHTHTHTRPLTLVPLHSHAHPSTRTPNSIFACSPPFAMRSTTCFTTCLLLVLHPDPPPVPGTHLKVRGETRSNAVVGGGGEGVSLNNIQCSEIFTLINENIHTVTYTFTLNANFLLLAGP